MELNNQKQTNFMFRISLVLSFYEQPSTEVAISLLPFNPLLPKDKIVIFSDDLLFAL